MPDIEFVKSPKTEKERLRHTRGDIVSGWFGKQGFVVVAEKNPTLSDIVQVVYPREFSYRPVDTTRWQREWELVGERFWNELEQLLPGSSRRWKRLIVKLTSFGTVSSSANTTKYRSDCGVFYLREDVDISHLAAMIVNVILYMERKRLGITWTRREALMDFIMTRSGMRVLFLHYEPVYANLLRVKSKVKKASEAYIESLGFGPKPKELYLIGRKIWRKNGRSPEILPKMERKVLVTLLSREGTVVSYDELADILWGEGNFRTFWAISKIVSRVRTRIKKWGITAEVRSVRGEGYVLRLGCEEMKKSDNY